MVLTGLPDTVTRKTGQSRKSDSTNTVQNTTFTNSPWSCLLNSVDATGPPDCDPEYQGPSKQQNEQYRNKDEKTTIYLLLISLTGRDSSCASASSNAFFICRILPTLVSEPARRLCNAPSCASSSRDHPSDILGLAGLRIVLGARRLKIKHAQQISLMKSSTLLPQKASKNAPDA